MSQEPRELTPVVFFKGDGPGATKDFRPVAVELPEPEVDFDPKDLYVTESALSSDEPPLEPEEEPVSVEQVPEPRTTEPSKPTSSTTQTTSAGNVTPLVSVKTPSSGSPSVEK